MLTAKPSRVRGPRQSSRTTPEQLAAARHLHDLIRDGAGAAKLARRLGVSRQYMSVVLAGRVDVSKRLVSDALALRLDDDLLRVHGPATYTLTCTICGDLLLTQVKRQRVCGDVRCRRAVVARALAGRTHWTDADMLVRLRERTGGRYVEGLTWEQLRDKKSDPSLRTITGRFGSWSRAVTLAGLTGVPPARGPYRKTWPRERVLDVLLRAHADGVVTTRGYEAWRRQPGVDAPSHAQVRLTFGGWAGAQDAVDAALARQELEGR